MKVAGYGRANLRKIETDTTFGLSPGALAARIAADVDAGFTPACVVASIGTTGTGGVDPLEAIAEICRGRDIFLHVDAAWAGSALLLPERRDCLAGIEGVDSFVFNPHKWLLTNFDCSAFFVRDAEALQRSLALIPDYLKTPEHDRVIDYQNWSVPLGRRFRALKLWFVIRSYGVDGLQAMLRKHLALAEALYREVCEEPDFEIMAPLSFALFNFRYRPSGLDDEAVLAQVNRILLEGLNASGELYLTQNRVRGRFAIRFAIGQGSTEERHVKAAWQRIAETARGLEIPRF
jgi:aromatic-L-amino-acid decarboxylase